MKINNKIACFKTVERIEVKCESTDTYIKNRSLTPFIRWYF